MPLLKALKREFSILALAPPGDYQHRLEAEGIPFYPLKVLKRKSSPFSDIQLFHQLYRLYRREKPEIVFHFTAKPNIFGSMAARLSRVPSLPTLTGLGYLSLSNSFNSQVACLLYKIALKELPLVAFHNPDDLRFFVEKKIIQEKQGWVVPGSGMDTDFFSFHPLPEETKVKFLMASRLLKDKGVREYALAARILKERHLNADFLIAGSLDKGNPAVLKEKEWQKLLGTSPLIYRGRVEDMRRLIREVHCLVLPSYREGLPRFLLEGMSMGRPLITTDVPGCRELVQPRGNGFLVPERNGTALADAMEHFLSLPPSTREKMGYTSRRMVEDQYSEKRVVEMYLNKAVPQILESW
jgi:glycosyltransferase involved in cell wall biosynthesis